MRKPIWLVRHGETDAPAGTIIGATDTPLGAGGREQARRLALEMAKCPLGLIISSDLQRAADTARAIAEPHHLTIERTAALRELDFGQWEGRSLAELWREAPAA